MKLWALPLPAARSHLSSSNTALRIFPLPPSQNAGRIPPLVSVDQSADLPLFLPTAGLPGSGVLGQGSFSVMPCWVVPAGAVGAAVVVTVSENG